jgi:eukaryotic-like serine/threonine-protein kinase
MSGSIAPRPGGTTRTVGGYDLVCEVTRGVLGTLWIARATDESRSPPAALIRRVPGSAAALERLVEGAGWGRRGREPGLPPIVDVVHEGGEVAVVTPFVEGEPLRALLRAAAFKRETLGADVALRVAVEVLEQLHAVHERTKYDPMHRAFGGLQPDSIYLGTDGLVRLLDIGLGVAAVQADLFAAEAQWLAYVSPEQLRGEEATAASDVFVVGAILWEMLANRRLFAGATAASVRERVLSGPIQRLDELRGGPEVIDGELATLVARALERDPAKRYPSVADLSDALRGAGKLATPAHVGGVVERLAEQFLDKRRALLDKAGVRRDALDGRTGVLERAAASAPEPAVQDAAGATGVAALARGSTSHGHGPPPPPSMRTSMPAPPSMRASMPPPPPSMRPPAAGIPAGAPGTSREDRALALAKAAAVASAAPPRSVPPPAVAPAPPVAAAPAAAPPAPAISPAPAAVEADPTPPEPEETTSAAGAHPDVPPAAVVAEVGTPLPGGAAPSGAPQADPAPVTATPPPVVSGSSPAAEPLVALAAPVSASPDPLGGIPSSAAAGMSPVVASIAAGPSSALDDDLDVPFARKGGGRKPLWIGVGAAAVLVAVIVAASGSSGDPAAEATPAAVAQVPAPPAADPPAAAEPEPAPPEPDPAAAAPEAPPEAPAAVEEAPAPEEAPKPAERKGSTKKAAAPKPKRAPSSSPPPAAPAAPAPQNVGAAFKPGGI